MTLGEDPGVHRRVLRAAGIPAVRKRGVKRHYKRRERKAQEGALLLWDGSPHRWFGEKFAEWSLMAAVDDATGKLLCAVFAKQEDAQSYLTCLNADHTHSLAKAVEAARAGFDAIVFDASTLPFEQNVRQTKEAVEALKAINPAILVEGEIGELGTGSEIYEKAPDLSKSLTTPEEAKRQLPPVPPANFARELQSDDSYKLALALGTHQLGPGPSVPARRRTLPSIEPNQRC
jgi:Fructose-bisphosphate aldolase class-II